MRRLIGTVRICETCGACSDHDALGCAFDGGVMTPLFPGARVLGERYLLEQRLAQGAMGVIFRATHLQLGSTVAVKLMRPRAVGLQVALARFQREAQILGQVKHPHAVLVMDFGVEERGTERVPYLVTEYLRGEALDRRLDQVERMGTAEALRIVSAVCEAVEEAHQVGVVHRDIKPGNIFLERLRDGSEIVKVLDFGIAKFAQLTDDARRAQANQPEPDADSEFLAEVADVRARSAGTVELRRGPGASTSARDEITEAGFMVGTLAYMAPEQLTGGRVSRQTDVYAVGVLLHRLLTGRLPHDGEDDDIIAAKLGDPPPRVRELVPEVPVAVDDLVSSCLALQPAERPAGAREVAERLRAAVRGNVVEPLPPGGTLVADVLAASRDVLAAADAWERTPDAEEPYARTRDSLLAMDLRLARLRDGLERSPSNSLQLPAARLSELDDALAAIPVALGRLGTRAPRAGEHADYLAVLWRRLHARAQAVVEELRQHQHARTRSGPLAAVFDDVPDADRAALAALAESLLARDPLESADALETLLGTHAEALLAALGRASARKDALAESLVRGLARHADALLLRELWPAGHRVRVLPLLARLDRVPSAAPFATLARLLAPEAGPALAFLAEPVDSAEPDAPARVLRRCLLAHSDAAVAARALALVSPAELWTAIVHPRTPIALLRAIFDRVAAEAPAEYLKVFFLCVRERMAGASSAPDLLAAFSIMQRFLAVPCFHEDIVFEPLLELDAHLRARLAEQQVHPDDQDAYAESLAAFAAGGAVETEPPHSFSLVPLPIQRMLARQGHFLAYFASHANERVARETLPHLLRMEDVTRYLRMPTIHRAVIVELARTRRLFRTEAARMALLQNPKTTAPVARAFLPFVSHEQLRFLAGNRHIGAEVRQLAATYVERLQTRRA